METKFKIGDPPPAPKFKVGDRIKFIRYKDSTGIKNGNYDGHTGKIFKAAPEGYIYVKFEENPTNGPNNYCFIPSACEIELLSPPPAAKFKVGDRVKYSTDRYRTPRFQSGKGTIRRVSWLDEEKVYYYDVSEVLGYYEDELTLRSPGPTPQSDPRVYNFKVTSPEEIDVQRICDEAPADVNLITLSADKTAAGVKTDGVLIRGELKSFEVNGVTVCPTSYYYLHSGKKIDLKGWQLTTNRRRYNERILAPMPEFLERLKKEIERQRTPAPPKKINVKVRYE